MRVGIIEPIFQPLYPGAVERYAADILGPDIEVTVLSAPRGPASVEGHVDVAQASAAMVDAVQVSAPCDAYVVNCFLDPGIDAIRELTGKPVTGAGEASMVVASQVAYGIGAVSLGANSQGTIWALARRVGLGHRLVYAGRIDVPVLALEAEGRRTAELIEGAAREAEQAAAEVLILGCTGLFRLVAEVRPRVRIPIIEPLAAGLTQAVALARMGIGSSRAGYYAGRLE